MHLPKHLLLTILVLLFSCLTCLWSSSSFVTAVETLNDGVFTTDRGISSLISPVNFVFPCEPKRDIIVTIKKPSHSNLVLAISANEMPTRSVFLCTKSAGPGVTTTNVRCYTTNLGTDRNYWYISVYTDTLIPSTFQIKAQSTRSVIAMSGGIIATIVVLSTLGCCACCAITLLTCFACCWKLCSRGSGGGRGKKKYYATSSTSSMGEPYLEGGVNEGYTSLESAQQQLMSNDMYAPSAQHQHQHQHQHHSQHYSQSYSQPIYPPPSSHPYPNPPYPQTQPYTSLGGGGGDMQYSQQHQHQHQQHQQPYQPPEPIQGTGGGRGSGPQQQNHQHVPTVWSDNPAE